MVGDDIEITVVDIRLGKVRLGIMVPPHVPVHRKEVYEEILRQNMQAKEHKSRKKKRLTSTARREHAAKSTKISVREDADSTTPLAGPLTVYIDSDAYTAEEKGELLSLISELYNIQSGDRLCIDNTGMAEATKIITVGPSGG